MAATKKGTTAQPARQPAAPAAKAPASATPKAKSPARTKADARVSPKAAPTAAKPAPVKLTGKQAEFLARVQAAGEPGYLPTRAESRSLDSLLTKKVLKKGAKDKTSGLFRVFVTRAGAKHLPAPSGSSQAIPAPPAAD